MSGIPSQVGCDWTINPKELIKYEQLFESLNPINGYIPGFKVKDVLMDSKLPIDTLGLIWDLADMDKDGKLDKYEFIIAMHLVYKALENYTIPTVLPKVLLKLKDDATNQNTSTKVNWIITPEEQMNADKLFIQADKDMDGFVSGLEVKDIFIQSGLSQKLLAHIWNLCDIAKSGKLNKEQFALALWLIKNTIKGIELPPKLTNEMIPPSFKNNSQETVSENNNVPQYTNPELEMINNDIVDILKTKKLLEQDIAQKESDITVKTGEIKSLQTELDTLAATLKQLENQKGEAQKRLNDLTVQVQKLRQQADEHEATLQAQIDELDAKRQEIECLRQEEQQLEDQQNKVKELLNDLTNRLQNTQLKISQTKTVILHLQELYEKMFDSIKQCDAALATGQAFIVPESALALPDIEGVIRDNIKDAEEKNNLLQKFFAKTSNDDNFEKFNTKDDFNNQNDDGFFKSDNKDDFTSSETKVEDPFNDDPFAALHAPPRSASPSPALPPKQAKKPPPRPAPPKSSKLPADEMDPFSSKVDPFASKVDPFAAKGDPFAGGDGSNKNSGFADFANFENSNVITSQPTSTMVGFTDDPFKDYRYDDPFLDNQDCFENEDNKNAKKF